MVAANAPQALAQAASAVLLLTGHAQVWELAALAAVRGIGTGFYFPASEGLLPHTCRPISAHKRTPWTASASTAARSAGRRSAVCWSAWPDRAGAWPPTRSASR
jgi:hypothetical protein